MEKSFAWLYLLGSGIVIVQILIFSWALRAIPPKDILNKYTKLDLFLSRLPFTESWKKHVSIEDQPRFSKYRNRLFLAQTTMILSGIFLVLFVQLWLAYRNT